MFPDLPASKPGLQRIDGPARQSPREAAALFRSGQCPPDREFDRYLPEDLQALSTRHWTPLPTVRRIARWAAQAGVTSILDIGSGVGKFCILAALSHSGLRVTGLEQRARLTAVARNLARAFDVSDRVHFIHGSLGKTATPAVDAYYLYNPFGENFLDPAEGIDHAVEVGVNRYVHDLAHLRALLSQARRGTWVLTYYGCGGRLPSAYDEEGTGWGTFSMLRLWRKVRDE